MRFALTEEQAGFAQSLGDLLAKADPVGAARAWASGDTGPGLAMWKRLADQGLSALVVAEEAGGLGGSRVDLTVAHEVLGHHLAVGPWIESSAFLATALTGEALEAVAGGCVATVALPPQVPFALDADAAERVYVGTGAGLAGADLEPPEGFDCGANQGPAICRRTQVLLDGHAAARAAALIHQRQRQLFRLLVAEYDPGASRRK